MKSDPDLLERRAARGAARIVAKCGHPVSERLRDKVMLKLTRIVMGAIEAYVLSQCRMNWKPRKN